MSEEEAKTFAAYEIKGELKPFNYKLRPLEDIDVHIKITHCGVCHSDLHNINNEWKRSQYPLVPGHEIVGIVTQVGKEVKGVKVGDRVGVGPKVGCCFNCTDCNEGLEQYCPKGVEVYNDKHPSGHWNYGGFADSIRVDHRFVFHVPEAIPSEFAAPLLCAGQTVYSPLKKFTKPGDTIGVIGIGGLGHMGIQFGKAMGCNVVAISTSSSKADFAKNLGAIDFIDSSNKSDMERYERKLTFVLNCIAGSDFKFSKYLPLLKTDGVICFVGIPEEKISIHPFALLRRVPIVGSSLASRSEIKEMLELAAKHKLFPLIEEFPIHEVNKAIERVATNQVRFRCVLKSTL